MDVLEVSEAVSCREHPALTDEDSPTEVLREAGPEHHLPGC